jgi:YHS domain-containing protein
VPVQLNILETTPDSVRAGYDCGCGCTPSVEYVRSATFAHEGCCCGNEFLVSSDASAGMAPSPGFHEERAEFVAPWGQTLHATWLVGSSVHPDPDPTGHDAADGHQHGDHDEGTAVDPVCGMTVDTAHALASALHLHHDAVDYYFCGRGCKLEFGDDPGRFLDASYTPTM